jgi:hypothetical protein
MVSKIVFERFTNVGQSLSLPKETDLNEMFCKQM